MGTITRNVFMCLLLTTISARVILEDYEKTRNNLLEEETVHALGGKLKLDDEEETLNKILMQLKEVEINEYFKNPHRFNFSKHYFTYRDEISNSKVYKIIKRMPKGGALHIHSTLMLGADYLLNLTYEDHLYTCYTDDVFELQFSEVIPQRYCPVKWTLLSELRNASDDVKAFDAAIKQHFTLYTKEQEDIDSVWKRFNKVYYAIKSLILYRPVREKFFYESLKRFYNDNVMYIEIRSGLHSLYELDGTQHERMYMVKLYQNITKKFREDYPDFIGIKLIVTKHRGSDIDQIRQALDFARQIKREVPEMFAGFDLVGQEDKGKPLVDFLPALLEAKEEMNFYFHGGETNWFGMATDENLIDAVLLGSKRIGHGYALTKHPTLMATMYKNDIAVEVNVISNAVLSLVRDVRNHPLAVYLALDFPVVLSSDDPGVWGAEPLSHDFYISFVGVASRHADLRTLKQLALNSIKYSALDSNEKENFYNVFDIRWREFVKNEITLNS
ncbi:adenosine deaminase 2-like [Hyposmocoma kahamanoa]|uniref:adenosine deaminase 2-like n=1 Tax=Hyposmocoma kahamanoa TaxID=1477025 RepID=UPI000E6D5C4C|nr:adenosine deaminase 2-like [Hyposmocoma kahamanoa]